jgi:hypothetical protein
MLFECAVGWGKLMMTSFRVRMKDQPIVHLRIENGYGDLQIGRSASLPANINPVRKYAEQLAASAMKTTHSDL